MYEKIKLTYFTPTYNRGKCLIRLYESLINQTNKNFIWLIIDDGSTDETENLVKTWKQNNIINIEYIKKENGGKHTAIETSNQVCTTEFIVCIDSDDYVTNNATEVIYSKFPLLENEDVCGIVGRCAHYDGTPFNLKWSDTDELIYFYDIASKYKYKQDTVLVFKTEVIKKYSFPIFENEKFVTEIALYDQFFYDYKMLMIKECIYLAEYQNDGYTSQGLNLFYKNPKGYAYALKQNCYYKILKKRSLKAKIFSAIRYYAWVNALKVDKDIGSKFKIASPYNIIGKMASVLLIKKYKKGASKFFNETGNTNKK